MNTRDLATVSLKILGVYWLIHSFWYIVRAMSMPFSGMENFAGFNWKLEMFSILFVGGIYAIIGFLFVFTTDRMLRVIRIDTHSDTSTDLRPSQTDYKRLAFSLLGAFFAIPAFTKIIFDLVQLWLQRQSTTPDYHLFEQPNILKNLPDLIENVLKLIIGMALILGHERLIKLWKRLRPLSANDK